MCLNSMKNPNLIDSCQRLVDELKVIINDIYDIYLTL